MSPTLIKRLREFVPTPPRFTDLPPRYIGSSLAENLRELKPLSPGLVGHEPA